MPKRNNTNKDPFYNLKVPKKVDPSVLQSKPYEYNNNNIWIEIVYPEFTSLCPMTGLPDFATIRISYIPNTKIVELKSLKYYFLGFRQEGIFYEHVVNKIIEDLNNLLKTKFIQIEAHFTTRGGMFSVVTAQAGVPPQEYLHKLQNKLEKVQKK